MAKALLISFVEWSGAFQRPQHLALGLAERGWDVTYLCPGYIHRRAQQVEAGIEIPPNLKILQPAALPGARKLGLIGKVNEANIERAIRRELPTQLDLVIFNDVRWATLAGKIPATRTIFDCMDDLSALAPSADWVRRKEEEALEVADLVWTGTASLADRLKGRGREVRYIPCGVDGERFAHPDPGAVEEVRAELAKCFAPRGNGSAGATGPLAGYFGMLNERVDVGFIDALAREGWRVLLIGPKSSQMAELPQGGAVRWIGPRPYRSLPAYLACMDLALIPYDISGPHRFLYPVKALEYLAGAKPVLSTPLPDVVRFLEPYVHLGATREDWSRVGSGWEALREDIQKKASLGQTYALGRSWGVMIDEMSEDLPSP